MNPILRNPILSAAFLSAGILFTGCLTDQGASDSVDELTNDVTQEVENMAANLDALMQSSALGKTSGDTVSGELVIQSYAWNPECACYIRLRHASSEGGFEATRTDTVKFLDGSGQGLRRMQLDSLASIYHSRTANRVRSGRTWDWSFVTTATLERGATTLGTWNGEIHGTYNEEELRSGRISNVRRERRNGRWQFPESGSIVLERVLRKYETTFLGNGSAEAHITNKRTGKVRKIDVQVN